MVSTDGKTPPTRLKNTRLQPSHCCSREMFVARVRALARDQRVGVGVGQGEEGGADAGGAAMESAAGGLGAAGLAAAFGFFFGAGLAAAGGGLRTGAAIISST